ncbi:universal stress protein UspE [Shewanella aestuarii]|uniref:Universal stress protein UspE n=1 Tax=Shewanella aestuarii TaxID=1028752 RepID=A0A6G9QJ32_9GAMM|nr:universal stress protein UspE [Shewanella aestuarii]QIR14564.1 universal stress protein UspE [Shewanella aestuarii]
MKEYKKILVVINPTTDHQAALHRAIELATKSQAEITAFLSIFDFSYEMTSILSANEREAMRQGVIDQRIAWLNDLISDLKETQVKINTEVVWHNRPFESVINFAIAGNFDLIVKSTHEHDKLKSIIFTPTDWHLMRKAPMPVLMVKEHDWPIEGKILCAINVASEDEDQLNLNTKIINYAQDLARKFSASVHLVNGFPGTPVNLAIELPDFDAKTYNDSVRMQHEERVQKLALSYNIPVENCHVEEGLPEDVIPDLAIQLDAELVILGTIGRTGFSAALIGNTAEHVIDSLQCDLLALKPDGYKSPLED